MKTINTDVLIIGGGTAGCFCALTLAENSDLNVIIAEKANIKRSGCLAAGVNALNAYINPGETPESFVEFVKKDFKQGVREDLVYSIAKRLNKVTGKIEQLGLPILKDEHGNYVPRGKRSIKINGEKIKPILAAAVQCKPNITVINKLNIVDYITKDGKVFGAYGFTLDTEEFITIYAGKTVCSTGGASGIYSPNSPGESRHKMWYCPFNTGAGYAMGIRAGAEMTSFDMRFIALRCKDTIAPTGTVAQGVKVPQINKNGEEYLKNYTEKNTYSRLQATVQENKEGRGPCYLKTKGITKEQEDELFKAYLNMAPLQTLKWLDNNTGPASENIEIEGTEPYITGGHSASGYLIDINRKTTLKNLYAIGDVAGGSPKKYVTGCFAEGEIAAESIIEEIKHNDVGADPCVCPNPMIQTDRGAPVCAPLREKIEQKMQQTMDKYAGGISQNYEYTPEKLKIAKQEINNLLEHTNQIKAGDFHELMLVQEIKDRLYVAEVMVEHLLGGL